MAEPRPDDADLTAYARIRNAALDLFGERGVAATSIRDVAAAAGVSPGLVQHHFGTKAALQQAVNEFVAYDSASVVRDLPPATDITQRGAVFGGRMAAVIRERPKGMVYMARLVSEGDPAGYEMFRALAKLGEEELRTLERDGVIDPGLDLEWFSIHVVVFNLGTLLFEPTISRVMGEPLLTEQGIERFIAAANAMFTRSLTPTAHKR